MHHAFLYIFLPSLHDYDVKIGLISRFMDDVLNRSGDQIFFPLVNLDIVLRNSTPGEFAYIWQSKWVEIIEMKIEKTLRKMEHSLYPSCPSLPDRSLTRKAGKQAKRLYIGGVKTWIPKTRFKFNNSIKYYSLKMTNFPKVYPLWLVRAPWILASVASLFSSQSPFSMFS